MKLWLLMFQRTPLISQGIVKIIVNIITLQGNKVLENIWLSLYSTETLSSQTLWASSKKCLLKTKLIVGNNNDNWQPMTIPAHHKYLYQ